MSLQILRIFAVSLVLVVLFSTAWVNGGCQKARFFADDVGVAASYSQQSPDIDEVVLADREEWVALSRTPWPAEASCELPRAPHDRPSSNDLDKELMAPPADSNVACPSAVRAAFPAPVVSLSPGHRVPLLRPPTA